MRPAITCAQLHRHLNSLRSAFYCRPKADMNPLRQAVFHIPRLLGGAPTSVCHLNMSLFLSVRPSVHPSIGLSVRLSVCLSIRCAPYLRLTVHHCTSSDYNFWYMCKMLISCGVFFFFVKFWFSGLLEGGRGGGSKRAKNSSKLKIPITSVMCLISGTL